MYAHRGFPFTEVQLRKLAYQIAVSEKKTRFSPTKKRAGRSWLKYFYKRQPELKKKVVSNLSIGRAMAANPGCIEKFFEDYSGWLKEWKLEYSPNSIWNVELAMFHRCRRSLELKGSNHSRQLVAKRQWIQQCWHADICFSWRIVIESYVNLQRSKQNGETWLHQDICYNHQRLDTSMQNCSTNMESISSSSWRNFIS